MTSYLKKMDTQKIKDFLASRDDFFKKREAILDAIAELEFLDDAAEAKLNESIDNGLDIELLANVMDEYRKSKFSSCVVQKFIEKIDKMFLSTIDSSIKADLDVVSLDVQCTSYNTYGTTGTTYTMSSPISIAFSNVIADKSFVLLIPIKGACHINTANWENSGSGMYKVIAYIDGKNIELCRAFDPAVAEQIINDYLSSDTTKLKSIFAKYSSSSLSYCPNTDDYGYFCYDYIGSKISKYFENTPISQCAFTNWQDSQNDICSITDIGKFKVQKSKKSASVVQ